MVKVIPWITKCDNCNVRLEYENEDILTVEHEYFEYNAKYPKKELYHYIICPKCHKKVYLY